MQVTVVPCLKDNYAYVLRAGSGPALVVDPSEAEPVLAVLDRLGAPLAAVLCTHHHWDHVGGNEELTRRYPGLAVYGHVSDRGRIPGQTQELEHGQRFDVAGLQFSVLHIPGHTLGAIAYVGHGSVFTGDTLFAAGCGRLFEGTPAMMHESLNVKLAALPDATQVYCGHEYTASNLRFAAHIEPGNQDVRHKATHVEQLRAAGKPTVPSTLGEERRTNPFMRVDSPEIVRSVEATLGGDRSPAAVLGAVRAAKDAF